MNQDPPSSTANASKRVFRGGKLDGNCPLFFRSTKLISKRTRRAMKYNKPPAFCTLERDNHERYEHSKTERDTKYDFSLNVNFYTLQNYIKLFDHGVYTGKRYAYI